MSKKIQRALSVHPSRGLDRPLLVLLSGNSQEIEVRIQGGPKVASLPVGQLRGPRSHKVERVSRLLSQLEEAELSAKQAASRAARKGFAFAPIYRASKASLLRSHGWPAEAIRWAENTVSLAVSLEASRAGRVRA